MEIEAGVLLFYGPPSDATGEMPLLVAYSRRRWQTIRPFVEDAPVPDSDEDCTTELHKITKDGPEFHQVPDAPQIPEWDLITAGDGVTRRPGETLSGERAWWPATHHEAVGLTDAEVLALGPVRRAVVVTLPDAIGEEVTIDDDGLIEIHKGSTSRHWQAKAIATELFAAALWVEAGGQR